MPPDHVEALVAKYCARGVLVDTNLLLLYCIGSHNRGLIPGFKRTARYTQGDFVILDRFLASFSRIITTPNILTEVSNLSGGLTGDVLLRFRSDFRNRIELLDESYCSSRAASADRHFARLGLTDAAIVTACKENHLVLTDDFPLAQVLQSRGVDVVNFNYIRVWAAGSPLA